MTNVKDLYAENKPVSAGGLFLKINDGENVRLRVLDIPVAFDSEYEGKISRKWAWPVYNHDEEEVQIFQGGSTIFNQIEALVQDDDWGDPVEYDIKVSRSGTGTDTKYNVSPSPKSKDVPTDIEMPNVVAVISKSPSASNVRKLGEAPTQKDVVLEDIDDKPIDLSEIPF